MKLPIEKVSKVLAITASMINLYLSVKTFIWCGGLYLGYAFVSLTASVSVLSYFTIEKVVKMKKRHGEVEK
jgi:hypothetical protein